jgi:flavin reductase (DIM6/NTAB) family NADH-FMN oxidoreductase RutF
MPRIDQLDSAGTPLARRLPAEPDDGTQLRRCFGMFATGVTVVTAGRVTPRGMTANSFTSVSLDPPLVLVCVKRAAAMHDAVLAGGAFGVSVLGAGQEPVARYFANHSRPRGAREFDVIDWTAGEHTGVPMLSGAIAWLECRLTAAHDGGDHTIFLGSVLASSRAADSAPPLLFFCGDFHQLSGTGVVD